MALSDARQAELDLCAAIGLDWIKDGEKAYCHHCDESDDDEVLYRLEGVPICDACRKAHQLPRPLGILEARVHGLPDPYWGTTR